MWWKLRCDQLWRVTLTPVGRRAMDITLRLFMCLYYSRYKASWKNQSYPHYKNMATLTLTLSNPTSVEFWSQGKTYHIAIYWPSSIYCADSLCQMLHYNQLCIEIPLMIQLFNNLQECFEVYNRLQLKTPQNHWYKNIYLKNIDYTLSSFLFMQKKMSIQSTFFPMFK